MCGLIILMGATLRPLTNMPGEGYVVFGVLLVLAILGVNVVRYLVKSSSQGSKVRAAARDIQQQIGLLQAEMSSELRSTTEALEGSKLQQLDEVERLRGEVTTLKERISWCGQLASWASQAGLPIARLRN